MLNLVLFGPPGAGKGTQSTLLIQKYGLIHLSTGDILRGEIESNTPLGIEAKKLMDKGMLVGDDVVIAMIHKKLEQNQNAQGFIFDGFPRTNKQAKALDDLLREYNSSITCMIALDVPDDELISRLIQRGKDSGRTDDSDPSIIKNRIEQYKIKTAPVASYYGDQDKYSPVNGMGSIEDIFNRVCNKIDAVVQ